MSKMSPRALEAFTIKFLSDFRQSLVASDKDGLILTAFRSLGPLFSKERNMVPRLIESFQRTGNVGQKDLQPNFRVNPLFVYSSIAYDRCAFPETMMAIAGFHTASAFIETTSHSVGGLTPYSTNLNAAEKLARVETCVKNQFKDWCTVFQKSLSSVAIYHHRGDIRFCYELQTRLDPTLENIFDSCCAPWNAPREFVNFNVDESPYGPFDVIETSSFADELALPVLLVSVLPLLKKNREATLYTTSYIPPDDTPPEQRLKSLLYCEPLTMFALLSVVPVEYVSGFCNSSSLHETVPADVHRTGVYSEWKFSWKRWVDNDSQAFEAMRTVPRANWETDTMGKILWDIYDTMFEITENSAAPPQCTPSGFSAFLRFLTIHAKADWNSILGKRLPDLIINSSTRRSSLLLSGDYIVNCHLHQLFSLDHITLDRAGSALLPVFQNTLLPPDHSAPPNGHPLAGPFILRVPRARLLPLVPYVSKAGQKGDLVLWIRVFHSDMSVGYFTLFETTFGTQDGTSIHPDPQGWEGDQDMFVHVYFPFIYLMLMMVAPDFKICLCIQHINEPQKYRCIYGNEMILFETNFNDPTHLFPCKPRKIVPSTTVSTTTNRKSESPKVGRVVAEPEITQSPGSPLRMTSRLDIYDDADKVDLVNGCEVKFESTSPWTIVVKTPSWAAQIALPYPHNKDTTRIRIARKSGWIEVIATLQTCFNVDTITFPELRDSTAQTTVRWNLPRLVITSLPTLKLSNSPPAEWLQANIDSMFSENELLALGTGKPEDLTPVNSIKFSLYSGLAAACGSGRHSSNVFMLQQQAVIGAFVFIDNIKLDSSAHSIVADAYVLPLTYEVGTKHKRDIEDLARHAISVECDAKVFAWWADFIQASIERSREWSHSEPCYANELARTHIEGRVMLCSCGAGKVSPEFRSRKDWGKFAPFVTRFALSPIFPVPYVDPIGAALEERFARVTDRNSSPAEVDVSQRCFLCKSTPEKLKKCGKCGAVKYCSRDCQAKDWARHKSECHS